MEGHAERTAMMERQHQRIMEKINDQLTHDSNNQRTGGMYNNMNMLHQYGAGGPGHVVDVEYRRRAGVVVGRALSGQCAGAKLRRLGDQCRDHAQSVAGFLSGLHVRLDRESLEKVREEETKNREARDKEGYDPGAVDTGVQTQWIQPLVLRGNQGDCVKIKLQQHSWKAAKTSACTSTAPA